MLDGLREIKLLNPKKRSLTLQGRLKIERFLMNQRRREVNLLSSVSLRALYIFFYGATTTTPQQNPNPTKQRKKPVIKHLFGEGGDFVDNGDSDDSENTPPLPKIPNPSQTITYIIREVRNPNPNTILLFLPFSK